MKITKYNQSCLLIETNNKRILIDPGIFGYSDTLLEADWNNIDIILVTHRHTDHCNTPAINEIIRRSAARLYTTKEVVSSHDLINSIIVKEDEVINVDNIKIEVTHASHGYITGMHEANNDIKENIGFIIDNGIHRLYTTSDTINFYNQYSCDILCMPFNGHGLTMGIIDGIGFVKAVNPTLLLPIHMEHPKPEMNPNIDILKETLEKENINYKILDLKSTVEI